MQRLRYLYSIFVKLQSTLNNVSLHIQVAGGKIHFIFVTTATLSSKRQVLLNTKNILSSQLLFFAQVNVWRENAYPILDLLRKEGRRFVLTILMQNISERTRAKKTEIKALAALYPCSILLCVLKPRSFTPFRCIFLFICQMYRKKIFFYNSQNILTSQAGDSQQLIIYDSLESIDRSSQYLLDLHASICDLDTLSLSLVVSALSHFST